MARTQYRYFCPTCGAWHWSIQYRKSILHHCIVCFQYGRHYRKGTLEAKRDRAAVITALVAAHAEPGP